MGRHRKTESAPEVTVENAVTQSAPEVTVITHVQMVRGDRWPEPRTANVDVREIEEYKKAGFVIQ